MRRLGAIDLRRVLAGARQQARIVGHEGRSPRRCQRFQPVGRRLGGIDHDRLAGKGGDRVEDFIGITHADLVAQPFEQAVADFFVLDEQFGRAVVLEDRLAQRQGRADDVAATDIEQPGQARRRSDQRGLQLVGLEIGGDPGALVDRSDTGIVQRLRHDHGHWLFGAFSPRDIERIRHRFQRHAGSGGGGLQAGQGGRADQP